MRFDVLKGKVLVAAIAAATPTRASTYKAHQHQVAYSALAHAFEHNDPRYLNTLYEGTPLRHRPVLHAWILAYGNVSFDPVSGDFKYLRGKVVDLEGARATPPADYRAPGSFDEIAYLRRVLSRLRSEGSPYPVLAAMDNVVEVAVRTRDILEGERSKV
jgi:hypothetical protein